MIYTISKQYYFFDSIILSEIELPELHQIRCDTEDFPPNTTISDDCFAYPETLSLIHHWKDRENRITLSLYFNENSYFLNFPNLITFKINLKSNHISFYNSYSIDSATIRHLLLDQVLPRFFAHFYNYAIFHGCSIALEKSAFAILGDSGYGKSTLAAYFSKFGHTVLTDDCLEISIINPAGNYASIMQHT